MKTQQASIGDITFQCVDSIWYVIRKGDTAWRRATPRMVELMRQYNEAAAIKAQRKTWPVQAVIRTTDIG